MKKYYHALYEYGSIAFFFLKLIDEHSTFFPYCLGKVYISM